MTGLAATMGADSSAATAIADALAARGTDLASWQAGGAHLVVRAAIPAVHEIGGAGALLLDGDASSSTLAAGYASGGVRTLVAGRDPYTVILVDLARNAMLLARNGDSPPLYWAQRGPAVLAASEPVALLAAGVPAEPDPAVVERFLATGACDDGPATFFAGVRRVLPGQVVQVTRPHGTGPCRVRVYEPPAAPAVPAAAALTAADLSGRIGVRLGCGVGAAAVLGTALGRPGRPRPLPVYSTSFPELATADSSAYCASALLGPYALGAARHRALPFFADELDVDAYLTDLGEPTPALDDWLRWAIARRVAGEVDALVDAGAGSHLSRLADRVASRFGVALRLPLREVPDGVRKAELAAVVERTLPSSAAGFAVAAEAERGPEVLLGDLLRRMRAELVTTFLRPRLGGLPRGSGLGRGGGLADALALIAGDRVDVAALWRRYLVERWLRGFPFQRDDHEEVSRLAGRVGTSPRDRRALATEVFAEGDKLPEKVAWYVGEAAAETSTGDWWYVLLAAKPVAVMQGRARNLWDIRPGLTARVLHRVAGRRCGLPGRPATPWAIQVAIDEGGWWRLVAAAAAAVVCPAGWYARIAGPAVRAIREPREDALRPSHVSVVPAPVEPDRVAAEVVAALRTAVPDSSYQRLGGCAVVSSGSGDVLGWAARPGAAPPPPGRLEALCAGDPFGDDHTPIVLAVTTGVGAPVTS